MSGTLIYTFTDGDETAGVKVEVYALDVDTDNDGTLDSVKFTFDTTLYGDYLIDLNGFFIDLGGNGGPITTLGGGNNMSGADNTGILMDGYDIAVALGTVGGNDQDFTDDYVIVAYDPDKSFTGVASLDGSDAGLRATSYGADREGSLKMTALYNNEGPPPPPDHFPEWSQNISNIVLYFDTAAGDTGRWGKDGFYTVKIDEVPGCASDDLDDWLAGVLAYLAENDAIIQQHDPKLLGVAIKGGNQPSRYFELDGNPYDIDVAPTPTGTQVTDKNIDRTYDYALIFPEACVTADTIFA